MPVVALATLSLASLARAQPTAGEPVNPWRENPARIDQAQFVPPRGDPIDPWRTGWVSEGPAAQPESDRDEVVDPWHGAKLVRRSGELLDPWADRDPGGLGADAPAPPTAAFPLVEPLEGEAEPDWEPTPGSGSRAAFPLLE